MLTIEDKQVRLSKQSFNALVQYLVKVRGFTVKDAKEMVAFYYQGGI